MKFGAIPTFLTVMLALIGLGVGHYLQQQDQAATALSAPPTAPPANCAPTTERGCPVDLTGHRALVYFVPAPQPLRPFKVVLEINPPVAAAILDFDMAGMSMGVNRLELQPAAIDSDGAAGDHSGRYWTGTALLPACASGRKDWLATLEVVTKTAGDATGGSPRLQATTAIPFELR